jgi:hypothetical protein
MIFEYSDSDDDSSVVFNQNFKESDSQYFTSISNSIYNSSKNNSYQSENYMYKVKEKSQKNKIKSLEKKQTKIKYKLLLQELKYKDKLEKIENKLYKKTYDSIIQELIVKNLKPHATIYCGILKALEGSPRRNKELLENYKPPPPPENYSIKFLLNVKKSINSYQSKGCIGVVEKLEKYYIPYFKKWADKRDQYNTEIFKETIPFINSQDGSLSFVE